MIISLNRTFSCNQYKRKRKVPVSNFLLGKPSNALYLYILDCASNVLLMYQFFVKSAILFSEALHLNFRRELCICKREFCTLL